MQTKCSLFRILQLFMVTGVTWSLLFAANVAQSVAFWYIAVLINALQGALIGLMFLLKGRVRALWQRKLQNYRSKYSCCRAQANDVRATADNTVSLRTSGDQPAQQSSSRLDRSNIIAPLNSVDSKDSNGDLCTPHTPSMTLSHS